MTNGSCPHPETKVLVTGGAGFIGSHTVELLLAQNFPVRVLDNFSSGKRENLPEHRNLSVIRGDIRDPQQLRAACHGITHVLHLAAQVSVHSSVEKPAESAITNVLGFVNTIEAARGAGVRRFVFASSAAVYGHPASLPLTEHSAVQPISPYGLEKLFNERYADLYFRLHGLSSMGLRYFNVYGPRQDPRSPYAGVISRFSSALRAGEPLRVFGDGRQTRDFIYVGDVAQANLRALLSDERGACNIGTGNSITLLQLIAELEKVHARSAQTTFLQAVQGDIRDSAVDPTGALRLLGDGDWTPLDHGLRRLAENVG